MTQAVHAICRGPYAGSGRTFAALAETRERQRRDGRYGTGRVPGADMTARWRRAHGPNRQRCREHVIVRSPFGRLTRRWSQHDWRLQGCTWCEVLEGRKPEVRQRKAREKIQFEALIAGGQDPILAMLAVFDAEAGGGRSALPSTASPH